MTPTNTEMIFWTILAIAFASFLFVVCPLINHHLKNKETERMFCHCERTVYHDDMEDVWED